LEVDDTENDQQQISKINALLRCHFKIDPETLSDKDWAKRYQELSYVKAIEFNNLFKVVEIASKKALAEILSQMFSK
jgi:selenophosphate synthetase-related protein